MATPEHDRESIADSQYAPSQERVPRRSSADEGMAQSVPQSPEMGLGKGKLYIKVIDRVCNLCQASVLAFCASWIP
jgi:hypothetical protein